MKNSTTIKIVRIEISGMEPETDKLSSNAAWADALAKILRQKKPKNRKYIVLSRAKKIECSKDGDTKNVVEIDDNVNKEELDEKKYVVSVVK